MLRIIAISLVEKDQRIGKDRIFLKMPIKVYVYQCRIYKAYIPELGLSNRSVSLMSTSEQSEQVCSQ